METLKNFWQKVKSENSISLETSTTGSTTVVTRLSWSGIVVVVGTIVILAIL